jgi:hypothetical protein
MILNMSCHDLSFCHTGKGFACAMAIIIYHIKKISRGSSDFSPGLIFIVLQWQESG